MLIAAALCPYLHPTMYSQSCACSFPASAIMTIIPVKTIFFISFFILFLVLNDFNRFLLPLSVYIEHRDSVNDENQFLKNVNLSPGLKKSRPAWLC